MSGRAAPERHLVGRNPSESGQFLTTITALATLPRETVANLKFSGCQIAHQAQPTDSPASIAAQIDDESAASLECGDAAVDVLGHVDSDGARKHRDPQQPNFLAEPFGGDGLRRRNRMLLGCGPRQLNLYRLHFPVQLFDEKNRRLTDGECQVVWGANLSSTAFEQEIARANAG